MSTYRFNGPGMSDPDAQKGGHYRRRDEAHVRGDEATVRSCGYRHTDNGWRNALGMPFGHHHQGEHVIVT